MYVIDRIVEIPHFHLAVFDKRLQKFKKIAEKLGIDPIEVSVVESDCKKVLKHSNGSKFLIKYDRYHIKGEAPVLNGWLIRARIDAGDHSENIIRSVVDIPEQYRNDSTFCEHCNSNRMRKKLFLVENEESGEWKRVGSTCMKQFVAFDEVDRVISMFEDVSYMLNEAEDFMSEEYENFGTSYPMLYDLDLFMMIVIDQVKRFGYESKSKSDAEFTTGSNALFFMTSKNEDSAEYRKLIYSNEELRSEALEVINYFKEIEPQSDYERVLRILAKDGFIVMREANYAASMYVTYKRVHEKESETKVNEYLDLVEKKRYHGQSLNLVKIIPCETMYGMSYLHMFEDSDGRSVKWFGTSRLGDEGMYNNLSFTVKGFEEYKGTKQTTITRVKNND